MSPELWCIYHVVYCIHAFPAPKPKFVAIVCEDHDLWGFLINSEVHDFIKSSPVLSKLQVPIKPADYPFLRQVSYINCGEIFDFDEDLLTEKVANITTVTKTQIKKIIPTAKSVAPKYRTLITK
jgi:hypothetical protein